MIHAELFSFTDPDNHGTQFKIGCSEYRGEVVKVPLERTGLVAVQFGTVTPATSIDVPILDVGFDFGRWLHVQQEAGLIVADKTHLHLCVRFGRGHAEAPPATNGRAQ